MPRQSNGNYVLPTPINPVVPGTAIEADWANTTMDDLRGALTDSLSRSGQGGMLAPLLFNSGSVTAPGIAFADESNSGMWRAALGDIQITVEGVPTMRFNNGVSSVWVDGMWKEVLYTGGAGTVPDGTTINDTLSWDGSEWIAVAVSGVTSVDGATGAVVLPVFDSTGTPGYVPDATTAGPGSVLDEAGNWVPNAGNGIGALVDDPSPQLGAALNGGNFDITNVNNVTAQSFTGIASQANAIRSSTTSIDVSGSPAPAAGEVLTATGGTAATWQAPASGGVMVGEIKFLAVLPSPMPFGWYQADGNNGTENLVGRFLGAIGSGLSAGANGSAPTDPNTGAAGATTLAIVNAGDHNHTVSVSGTTSTASNNHAHQQNNATFEVNAYNSNNSGGVRVVASGYDTALTSQAGFSHTHTFSDPSSTTSTTTGHVHPINNVLDHVHTTSGNTLPPYFGMYVIQYTGA
tara:strand:+ start:2230 stop:3615 length:1386 start_codon:yes stop_codon:yes gene_type:complete